MADRDPDTDLSRLGLPARGSAPAFIPAEPVVDRLLHKARTRQLTRTSALVLALALPVALLVSLPGEERNDSLVAVTPSNAPTSQPLPDLGPPSPLPSAPTRSGALPGTQPDQRPGAAGGPESSPAPVVAHRLRPSPASGGAPQAAAQPAPAGQRPAYAGQIGPRYSQFQGTDCVVYRSSGDDAIRNDYCIYLVNGGTAKSWQPYVRICRLYDSTSPGRLTFRAGQEADFALYSGKSTPNGPVVDKLLFRFSDTVRYDDRAHGRDVSQGDCWVWQLNLAWDFSAYPADAGFVGEWRSYAEQIPAPRNVQRLHFTAGGIRGD